MKLLVTGATGFVGGRLAAALVDRGDEVTALARDPARLAVAGARPVAGALDDAGALHRACEGQDVVVHVAARASDAGARAAFFRDNVDGTLALARAALEAGVRRLVYVSTISVYGFAPPALVDEDTPVGDLGGDYPYAESKLVGERALAPFSDRLELVVVRLGSVYGPGSAQWTARPVRVMRRPPGLMLIDGGAGLHNYVYIDNAVAGLIAAATHDAAAGELFNLTDGTVSYREFFGYYAAMLPRPPALRSVGRVPALAIAAALEAAARARGKAPLLTPVAVRLLARRAAIRSERIAAVLGHRGRVSLEEGMEASRGWLREQRLI